MSERAQLTKRQIRKTFVLMNYPYSSFLLETRKAQLKLAFLFQAPPGQRIEPHGRASSSPCAVITAVDGRSHRVAKRAVWQWVGSVKDSGVAE